MYVSRSLIFCVIVTLVCGPIAAGSDCLDRAKDAIHRVRKDLPAMRAHAETAAQHLVAGGQLYASGQPSMISEVCGRAGGYIMLLPWSDQSLTANDTILHFAGPGISMPAALASSDAIVAGFGAQLEPGMDLFFSNYSGETGISPTLSNAIPVWVFLGELFSASTRLGKTPAMYESIGMYSAQSRNDKLRNDGSMFHQDLVVPAIEANRIGNAFLDQIDGILSRIRETELQRIRRTAEWSAQAKRSGKTLYMYSMGHLFPDEVGNTAIGTLFQSHGYNAGFRTTPPPGEPIASGDVVVYIGYQHAPSALLDRAHAAGARMAYVSLHADRDYVDDVNTLWIDPMWDWPDGCVAIEGYDVPILPASGIVDGVIAWQIYENAAGLLYGTKP
jgi:hypothetical protein